MMADVSLSRRRSLRERLSGSFRLSRPQSANFPAETRVVYERNPEHPAVHPNGAKLRPRSPEFAQSRRSLSISQRRISMEAQNRSPPILSSNVGSKGREMSQQSGFPKNQDERSASRAKEKTLEPESSDREGTLIAKEEEQEHHTGDSISQEDGEDYAVHPHNEGGKDGDILENKEQQHEETSPRRGAWKGLKRTMRSGKSLGGTPRPAQQEVSPPKHHDYEAPEEYPPARVITYQRAKPVRTISGGSNSSSGKEREGEAKTAAAAAAAARTAFVQKHPYPRKSMDDEAEPSDEEDDGYESAQEQAEYDYHSNSPDEIGVALTVDEAEETSPERAAHQYQYHWSINQDLQDLPNASPAPSMSYSNGVINNPIGDLRRRIREMSIQEDPETTVDVDNEVHMRPAVTHERIKPHVHHRNEVHTTKNLASRRTALMLSNLSKIPLRSCYPHSTGLKTLTLASFSRSQQSLGNNYPKTLDTWKLFLFRRVSLLMP